MEDIKLGTIWQLGKHRLMYGDSTKREDISLLVDKKVNLIHADPPYGMKKEKKGVLNDNLNNSDLLEFNKSWFNIIYDFWEENGSFYCWGKDEHLMIFYSYILKPKIDNKQIIFRNLITWEKETCSGKNSTLINKYPVIDEKCIFAVHDCHGSYDKNRIFEDFKKIQEYLLTERKKSGWSVKDMKNIAGHSDKSSDHWTTKSQWTLPSKKVYSLFQKWAKDNSIVAFQRDYEDLKAEYEQGKQKRAYFNNVQDSMTNVWHFGYATPTERKDAFGHPTIKPQKVCERIVRSSTREQEIVLDVFGGSGSMLIACENLNRICYTMELSETYVINIIKRWENLTGKKAKIISN